MLPNVADLATCCHFVQNCPKMDNFFFLDKKFFTVTKQINNE